MRKLIFLTTCLLFFIGCKEKYPGYKLLTNGSYFKLLAIGDDGARKIKGGDYITVDIAYATLSDSMFFEGQRRFQVIPPSYKGSLDDNLMLLSLGESAEFIMDVNPFFNQTLEDKIPDFLKDVEKVKIKINVLDIQSEKEYNNEKEAFLNWIKDFGEYEQAKLRQYLDDKNITVPASASGLVHLVLNKGNGRKVNPGDTLVLHFEGRFLNGKFFDSTLKRKDPFQFVYGQEWQVIKGLEEGIGSMEENEKCLFIIPSQLAFGDIGSSTGIVPPYTSLIFEVELVDIK